MTPATRRPSMADVADLAGVSYQTVSRVLNEPHLVRPDTSERVLSAIAELGYRRNRAARALKTAQSSLIGVLAADWSFFGPGQTTNAIEAAARQAGYAMLLATVDTHPSQSDAAPDAADLRGAGETLLEADVDGILAVAPHDAMIPAVEPLAGEAPIVSISAEPLGASDIQVVGAEQEVGARQAVEHLRRQGHERIVHLAGPSAWFDARARRRGIEVSLDALGLDGEILAGGDWTPASGYELGTRLARGPLPDAVFAANDLMAIGAMRAFHEHGLRVPGDVAVMGFDDIPSAAHLTPSLTTVEQPFAEVGRAALALLLATIKEAAPPDPAPGALSTALVPRESSRCER